MKKTSHNIISRTANATTQNAVKKKKKNDHDFPLMIVLLLVCNIQIW